MNENSVRLIEPQTGYADCLSDLKTCIHTTQQRATLAVDREPDAEIVQQAVGQLPWGHNLVPLTLN
jgi:hypothetical protein